MFFREVVGHEELKEKLIKDVNENKISHAHLFLGKFGYGGLPLALSFVQFMMCKDKKESDSCGKCSNCKRVEKLEHPDLHFSFPVVQAVSKTSENQLPLWKTLIKKNPYSNMNKWIQQSDEKGRRPIISVFQSMEIINQLALKSFDGGHKVSLIWGAEDMNTACANKLLKIIEEPPQNTVFILIAESEENILPTILSRTQILRIKPLKSDDIKIFLKDKFSQDLIENTVYRAEGDFSTALDLVNEEQEENMNFHYFVDLMRNSYKKDVQAMMDWAGKLAELGKEEQKHFLKYALYLVRQSLVKNYIEDKLLSASDEEVRFLNNFAKFITGNNVMDFNRLFNDAHYNIERNAHSKLLFTNITFEVMRYIHRA